ncbi:hypothetical protein AB0E75_10555 [Streptomyces griseoviridis]|uniref:Outer membrane channel protein CpnT-like N-terminal domain-containing protein n=1 Tax=Streptomyces griseoviridis TaxID=45398 RepID=A0A918GKP6_STRGD|nr:hypothetical protein [Streptomyces niveoruber]GGS41746.1 hypothetical protein GCM10010238_34170 [Streptomyces niveoruber]
MLTPSPAAQGLMEALSGMKWPSIDEDRLRAVADDYDGLAAVFGEIDKALVEVGRAVAGSFAGESAEAFVALADVLAGGDDSFLGAAAKQAQHMADIARSSANQAEYYKWMILAQVIELLAEMMFEAAVWWVPGLGQAVAAEVAFRTALLRTLLPLLMKRLLLAIAQHVAISTSLAFAMDRIIQLVQKNQGHRDKFDDKLLLDSLKFAAIQGVITGPVSLLGAGLGTFLGNRFGTGFDRMLRDDLGTLFKQFGRAGGDEAGGNRLGRAFADLLSSADNQLQKGFGKEFKDFEKRFIAKGGDLFERHGFDGLTGPAAREIGEKVTRTVVEHWGGAAGSGSVRHLTDRLRTVLGGTVSKETAETLSRDLPAALAKAGHTGNLRFKLTMYGTDMVMQGVGQNLAEGVYNQMHGYGFTSTWETFLSGFLTTGLSHGAREMVVHPLAAAVGPHVDTEPLKALVSKLTSGGVSRYTGPNTGDAGLLDGASGDRDGAAPPSETPRSVPTESTDGRDGEGSAGDEQVTEDHRSAAGDPDGTGADADTNTDTGTGTGTGTGTDTDTDTDSVLDMLDVDESDDGIGPPLPAPPVVTASTVPPVPSPTAAPAPATTPRFANTAGQSGDAPPRPVPRTGQDDTPGALPRGSGAAPYRTTSANPFPTATTPEGTPSTESHELAPLHSTGPENGPATDPPATEHPAAGLTPTEQPTTGLTPAEPPPTAGPTPSADPPAAPAPETAFILDESDGELLAALFGPGEMRLTPEEVDRIAAGLVERQNALYRSPDPAGAHVPKGLLGKLVAPLATTPQIVDVPGLRQVLSTAPHSLLGEGRTFEARLRAANPLLRLIRRTESRPVVVKADVLGKADGPGGADASFRTQVNHRSAQHFGQSHASAVATALAVSGTAAVPPVLVTATVSGQRGESHAADLRGTHTPSSESRAVSGTDREVRHIRFEISDHAPGWKDSVWDRPRGTDPVRAVTPNALHSAEITLPKGLTAPRPGDRVPTLGPGQFAGPVGRPSVLGFGPTEHIRRWAVDHLPSSPDPARARAVDRLLSRERLTAHGPDLLAGGVGAESALAHASAAGISLGRAKPVGLRVKALWSRTEIRTADQYTARDETVSATTAAGSGSVQAGFRGPLGDTTVTVGGVLGVTGSHGHQVLGGGAGQQTTGAKYRDVPTALAVLDIELPVRLAGGQERVFTTSMVIQSPLHDLWAMAGWDDRLGLRQGDAEPPVPPFLQGPGERKRLYLTSVRSLRVGEDVTRPVTSGEGGAGGDTRAEAAADAAYASATETLVTDTLAWIAEQHPTLVVPQREAERWKGGIWRSLLQPQYARAVHNTLQVVAALQGDRARAALHQFQPEGVPILLLGTGAFSRDSVMVTVRPRFDDPVSYVGTDHGLQQRFTVGGSARGGSAQTTGFRAALGVTARGTRTAGGHTLGADVGLTASYDTTRRDQALYTATSDALTQLKPAGSHLYRLTGEFTVSMERSRHPGYLVEWLPGLGDRHRARAVPGADDARRIPFEIDVAVPDRDFSPPEGAPPATPRPAGGDPLRGVRSVPLQVSSHPELIRTALDAAASSSHRDWRFAVPATPHSFRIERALRSPALTGRHTDLFGATGLSLPAFHAPGAFRGWLGGLRVSGVRQNLRALSGPFSVDPEVTVSLGVGLESTTASAHGVTGGLSFLDQSRWGGATGLVTAGPWSLGHSGGFAEGASTTTVRDVNNVYDSEHWVLVAADVDYRVEAAGTDLGLGSLLGRPGGTADRTFTVPDGYVGLVPEQVARDLGLLDAGAPSRPAVPRPVLDALTVPRSYLTDPVGLLPAAGVRPSDADLASLGRQLKKLSAPESLKETVFRALSESVGRAHMQAGVPVVTQGRRPAVSFGQRLALWNTYAELRVDYVPRDARLLDIATFGESRVGHLVTSATTGSAARGAEQRLASTAAERAGGTPSGMSESVNDTHGRSRATGTSDVSVVSQVTAVATPFAEVEAGWDVVVSLRDSAGRHLLTGADGKPGAVVLDGGTHPAEVPLGFLDSVPGGPGLPVVDTRVRDHAPGPDAGSPLATLRRENAPRWEELRDRFRAGHELHVERVHDAERVQDLLRTLIDRAVGGEAGPTGTPGVSPLTRPGRQADLMIRNGANAVSLQGALAGGTLLGDAGHRIIGVRENAAFAPLAGDVVLHAVPRLSDAKILRVSGQVTLENVAGSGTTVSESSGSSAGTGGAAQVTGGVPEGFAGVQGSRSGAVGTTTVTAETNERRANRFLPAGRAYLVAVPTTFLATVGTGHPVGGRVFGASGRQAASTETVVQLWVREELAREAGLLDETRLPEATRTRWEEADRALDALRDNHRAWREVRRRLDPPAAGRRLDEARTALDRVLDGTDGLAPEVRAATADLDLRRAERDAADTALARADADLDLFQRLLSWSDTHQRLRERRFADLAGTAGSAPERAHWDRVAAALDEEVERVRQRAHAHAHDTLRTRSDQTRRRYEETLADWRARAEAFLASRPRDDAARTAVRGYERALDAWLTGRRDEGELIRLNGKFGEAAVEYARLGELARTPSADRVTADPFAPEVRHDHGAAPVTAPDTGPVYKVVPGRDGAPDTVRLDGVTGPLPLTPPAADRDGFLKAVADALPPGAGHTADSLHRDLSRVYGDEDVLGLLDQYGPDALAELGDALAAGDPDFDARAGALARDAGSRPVERLTGVGRDGTGRERARWLARLREARVVALAHPDDGTTATETFTDTFRPDEVAGTRVAALLQAPARVRREWEARGVVPPSAGVRTAEHPAVLPARARAELAAVQLARRGTDGDRNLPSVLDTHPALLAVLLARPVTVLAHGRAHTFRPDGAAGEYRPDDGGVLLLLDENRKYRAVPHGSAPSGTDPARALAPVPPVPVVSTAPPQLSYTSPVPDPAPPPTPPAPPAPPALPARLGPDGLEHVAGLLGLSGGDVPPATLLGPYAHYLDHVLGTASAVPYTLRVEESAPPRVTRRPKTREELLAEVADRVRLDLAGEGLRPADLARARFDHDAADAPPMGVWELGRFATHLRNRPDGIAGWRHRPADEAAREAREWRDNDPGERVLEEYPVEAPSTATQAVAGHAGPIDQRRYHVRRLAHPDGSTTTELTVRIFLSPEAGAQHLSDEAKEKAHEGVTRYLSGAGYRLPDGARLAVRVEFTDSAEDAHHTVGLTANAQRAHSRLWSLTDDRDSDLQTLAHEIGHLLGFEDQYRELNVGKRPFYRDVGLMTGTVRTGADGLPTSMDFHSADVRLARDARLMPRDLLLLGSDGHRHPTRPTDDIVPLEVRRRLRDLWASAVPVPDAPAHPNGTYRARVELGNRNITMFPGHWTFEEQWYAAQQVYLEERRLGRIGAGGRFEGVYQGVRVHGHATVDGRVTDFAASDRQADLLPSTLLDPALVRRPAEPGPRLMPVAQDFLLHGDHAARVGGHIRNHYSFNQGRDNDENAAHHTAYADAGPFRSAFLDVYRPEAHPLDFAEVSYHVSRREPADGLDRTRVDRLSPADTVVLLAPDGDALTSPHALFPDLMFRSLRAAVGSAHRDALLTGAVLPLEAPGSYLWSGSAMGVRMHGLVAGGDHRWVRPSWQQDANALTTELATASAPREPFTVSRNVSATGEHVTVTRVVDVPSTLNGSDRTPVAAGDLEAWLNSRLEQQPPPERIRTAGDATVHYRVALRPSRNTDSDPAWLAQLADSYLMDDAGWPTEELTPRLASAGELSRVLDRFRSLSAGDEAPWRPGVLTEGVQDLLDEPGLARLLDGHGLPGAARPDGWDDRLIRRVHEAGVHPVRFAGLADHLGLPPEAATSVLAAPAGAKPLLHAVAELDTLAERLGVPGRTADLVRRTTELDVPVQHWWSLAGHLWSRGQDMAALLDSDAPGAAALPADWSRGPADSSDLPEGLRDIARALHVHPRFLDRVHTILGGGEDLGPLHTLASMTGAMEEWRTAGPDAVADVLGPSYGAALLHSLGHHPQATAHFLSWLEHRRVQAHGQGEVLGAVPDLLFEWRLEGTGSGTSPEALRALLAGFQVPADRYLTVLFGITQWHRPGSDLTLTLEERFLDPPQLVRSLTGGSWNPRDTLRAWALLDRLGLHPDRTRTMLEYALPPGPRDALADAVEFVQGLRYLGLELADLGRLDADATQADVARLAADAAFAHGGGTPDLSTAEALDLASVDAHEMGVPDRPLGLLRRMRDLDLPKSEWWSVVHHLDGQGRTVSDLIDAGDGTAKDMMRGRLTADALPGAQRALAGRLGTDPFFLDLVRARLGADDVAQLAGFAELDTSPWRSGLSPERVADRLSTTFHAVDVLHSLGARPGETRDFVQWLDPSLPPFASREEAVIQVRRWRLERSGGLGREGDVLRTAREDGPADEGPAQVPTGLGVPEAPLPDPVLPHAPEAVERLAGLGYLPEDLRWFGTAATWQDLAGFAQYAATTLVPGARSAAEALAALRGSPLDDNRTRVARWRRFAEPAPASPAGGPTTADAFYEQLSGHTTP